MKNINILNFKEIKNEYGSLVPLETNSDIPFKVKRVYYIFGVGENIRRGFHSHKDLEQALICLNGEVKILVKTPEEEKIVLLNDPKKALYIGPMIWREMFDFSPGSVLLVLASRHYDESDYIRDYALYESMAENYF